MICGVPDTIAPKWVVDRVHEQPVPNLGAYIRPEYRDITYFRGIDYHQDIIDFPNGDPDFVTLYVYLHEVTENDAPLWACPRSHLLGASTFPHSLNFHSKDEAVYSDDDGSNAISVQRNLLIGEAGSIYFWHSSVIHGTGNITGDKPRISLRYLIRCGQRPANGMDAFSTIHKLALNPTSTSQTRVDIEQNLRGNYLKDVVYGEADKNVKNASV